MMNIKDIVSGLNESKIRKCMEEIKHSCKHEKTDLIEVNYVVSLVSNKMNIEYFDVFDDTIKVIIEVFFDKYYRV